jgi:hypothetical protein
MRDAAGMMTYEYTYYCCDCRSPMALVAGKRWAPPDLTQNAFSTV